MCTLYFLHLPCKACSSTVGQMDSLSACHCVCTHREERRKETQEELVFLQLPPATCTLDHAWIKGEGYTMSVKDCLFYASELKSDICTVPPVKAAVYPHASLTIRQSTYLFPPPATQTAQCSSLFSSPNISWKGPRLLGGKKETKCQFPKLLLLFLQYAFLVLLLPSVALRSSHKSTLEPTTTIAQATNRF